MFGKIFIGLLCCGLVIPSQAIARTNLVAGPIFSRFSLTLENGERTEAAGPLYYSQKTEDERQAGFPPFYCQAKNPDVEMTEFSFLYPGLTYRRYGGEYRLQIGQLLSFNGGKTQDDTSRTRRTFFPFYFEQRSTNKVDNYTAFLPFYGHLNNRLMRDEINFVMFPVYSKTRKKDVVTENYFYPFYHKRHGNELEGWQAWPFYGEETKGITYKTNALDEKVIIPGHCRHFVFWPFYFDEKLGMGGDNPEDRLLVLPFYHRSHSPKRDLVSYGWPIGYTSITDREAKYVERGFPWPLWCVARGEGKTTTRYFPFYSDARGGTKESRWYMWPVYKFNRLNSAPLDRKRTRIMMFLYSDITEVDTDSGRKYRRSDCWPLFTWRRDQQNNERLQVLSIMEPLMPNNRTVAREYGPVYSIWRSEKNGKTGATSQSLFWNLYRRESAGDKKMFSLLFGLLKYQSDSEGKSWQACYLPIEGERDAKPGAKP